MTNCKLKFALAALCLIAALNLPAADAPKPLYENNFESAEVGKIPDEFLVLDGGFAVQAEGTNKFLELPGAPLDSFGVMFGPSEKENVAMSARIFGTKKGRRFPTFGVGLDGQGGYRLRVAPAKGALEIYKGDDSLASVPYDWKSGEWTMLYLQVAKIGDTWKISGKAWVQGAAEPAQPLITYDEKKEPSAGKASVWGSPFSNQPIRFDDLLYRQIEPSK
jgi:hypothetical protein